MTDSPDPTTARPGAERAGPASPRHRRLAGAAAALAAVALLLAPTTLTAHGEGVLELASSSVAAGGELAVEGSEFETGATYRLVLVGALDEREIGDVRPDSAGDFSASLTVPADVGEGRYQLTAVAPDGDVVARVELAVLGGAATESDGETGDADGSEARADDMPLDRDRNGTEWAVVALLVGAAGGAGVRLLRG